jgi:hypothetical protein
MDVYTYSTDNQVSDILNPFAIFKKLERKLDYMSSIYCHKCPSHIVVRILDIIEKIWEPRESNN